MQLLDVDLAVAAFRQVMQACRLTQPTISTPHPMHGECLLSGKCGGLHNFHQCNARRLFQMFTNYRLQSI